MNDTPTDPREEHERLERAAARLLKNENFMLIANRLFKLSPPQKVAFSLTDGYNPHAAAFRDGSRSVTALLHSLMYPADEKEPAKRKKVKAEFTGDTP